MNAGDDDRRAEVTESGLLDAHADEDAIIIEIIRRNLAERAKTAERERDEARRELERAEARVAELEHRDTRDYEIMEAAYQGAVADRDAALDLLRRCEASIRWALNFVPEKDRENDPTVAQLYAHATAARRDAYAFLARVDSGTPQWPDDDDEETHGYSRSDLLFGGNW